MRKQTQYGLWYLIGAVLLMLLLQLWVQSTMPVEHVSYSTFRSYLKEGKVTSVTIGRDQVTGNLKPVDGKEGGQISAVRVAPELAADLEQFGVEVRGTPESGLAQSILSWILPTLFFFGLWFLLMRGFGGKGGIGSGLMPIGKSNAKVYVETDTKVTFDDVAGVDEAKEELKEVVDFLKDPKTLGRLGARVPRGILLVGPPGTGKTLLARAVAGEAGVPFFSVNGSEFVEMFVGVGAARVRDLFDQARQHSPAIIFIDELDALGRARGVNAFGGGHDEKEQTLNQLLSELDGFDAKSGLVLLAATNRPEILDPALLRAGRFDRQVLVDRPDRKGRAQIAEIYLRRVHRASDATAEAVAALTPGFTGADLANLINESAMAATRRQGDAVTLADITVAIERIVAGLEKRNRILNEAERKTIAHHEMGHALVSLVLSSAERVHKVSIIPRGIGALGYTIQRPTEDRYLMNEDELAAKMAVLLAGRAAEQLVFGKVSTGAADDLAKATDLARSMVTQYGMSKSLGGVSYDRASAPMLGQTAMDGWWQRRYSEETAREIDCAVRDLVNQGLASALAVLSSRRAALEQGAQELLAKETLLEGDILRLLGEKPGTPSDETATRAA